MYSSHTDQDFIIIIRKKNVNKNMIILHYCELIGCESVCSCVQVQQ